jgi:hypothetical protein
MAHIYQSRYEFLEDKERSSRENDDVNDARSLELALESSGRGSRYGQFTLGQLHCSGKGGLAQDYTQAVEFYRLAAAQGLDCAQLCMGWMYEKNWHHRVGGVDQDDDEALRWYQLAAAQGHPAALYSVAECHHFGCGVAADVNAAIHWYRRAQVAGSVECEGRVEYLSSRELT